MGVLIYLKGSPFKQQGKYFRLMQKPSPTNDSAQRGPAPSWIKRSQQQSLLVLVASCLVLMASYWLYLGGHRGRLIEIDRADPLTATYAVDVNRADWPEIVQLPGVGETLARRIISDRREHGPFRDIDDLDRVDGIGLRTLERIRPYLMPIPKDSDWAGLELESAERVQ
jgi:competence protein ComEA